MVNGMNVFTGMHPTGMLSCYRPQRSCEGYVFTRVCHSVHKGGCVVSKHALQWYPSMPCNRGVCSGGGACLGGWRPP